MIKNLLLLSIPLIIIFFLLPGCISPKVTVNKTIFVTSEEPGGTVTINMNSGTSIEADIQQEVKDLIKATIPLIP